MRDYLQIAEDYAADVVAGRIIAGRMIELACRRFQADREAENDPEARYWFSETAASMACGFVEALPHVKGKWAKEREALVMQPWQVFFVAQLFGWLRTSDQTRRFRKASLYVARKNGKSPIGAAIGLYCLTLDDEAGAEIYCGATTEQQAWEVFRPAKQMVERTPDLRKDLGVEVNARSLFVPSTGSMFVPLIGKPGDGAGPHLAIIDEYHEHGDSSQYDTMLTGMAAREQPLLLVISTAGESTEGPCRDDWKTCEMILEGQIEDEEHLCLVYATDPDDDWADPTVLPKANPNMGVSVSEEFLRARIKEAVENPRHQQRVRIKHLNQWVGARNAYFDARKWKESANAVDLEMLRGRSCFVGVDLAAKHDLAAVQYVFPPEEEGGSWYTFGRYYLPEAATEGKDRAHFAGWAETGHLVTQEGAILGFEAIQADILGDSERFRILKLAFDQHDATQLVTNLMDAGIECVQVPQTVMHLSTPMKEMYGLILAGVMQHDGNPCMEWMIGNVVAKEDANGNVFPRKARQGAKIDGPVALINALAAWERSPVQEGASWLL